MLSFELLARIRKELSLTGSALYETIVAIAERVNRKVHVLRLHGQATTILHQIHTIHQHVGQRIATAASAPAGGFHAQSPSDPGPLEDIVRVAAERIKGQRAALQLVERQIRELKIELAHEDLLTMQRELGLRDAAIERVVVVRGAPVIGHPIGEFDLPPTTHIAAVFRGPFLLPLSDAMTLRPDDIVILVGLRHDLTHWLPYFQRPAASKTA
ncbi:MAG TPA: TrkA C-terminal domain-containing protein [Nitrospira sp.]|jgi:K+/H+ antiporter YhaU regulatory subunit KhtT|nr:TrkA C-terminal domain-containing protein [Nitrospira sp.]MBS0162256.1 TrkA C-terminal domain-containing protein [Nitrospira sp.]MBS0172881.1 TrkA C-terminal domain-containing protein [Nitrospira sp.]MBS0178567.1 TrkA C-terminal domain-containing protein [Nitrospira sp.]MBX3338515.1 TrkA C-terminal domain-containing protein [Nitrospira sp.]